MVLVAIVVVVFGVVVLGLAARQGGGEGEPEESSVPEGPSMLVQEPQPGPAYRFGPATIYNACSLLTLDDLRQARLSISPDQLLAESYPVVDQPEPDAEHEPSLEDVSTCGVFLDDDGFASVAVSQAPYNDMDFLARRLPEWRQEGESYQVGDTEVILRRDLPDSDRGQGFAVVVAPSAIVEVSVTGRAPRDYEMLVRELVDKVVPRLSQPQAREFALSYGGSYGQPDPCELLTASDVEAVLGAPAEGFVNRQALVADNPLSLDNGRSIFYTETICLRSVARRDLFSQGEVRLSLFTYHDVDSAEALMQQKLDPESSSFGPPVVLEQIGDDRGRITPPIMGDRSLEFRVGRHLVQLNFSDSNVDAESPSVLEQRLVPVAGAIAERLR